MNRQRRNYVRNVRLNLARGTALHVIRSLESSVEDVGSLSHLRNTGVEESVHAATKKKRRTRL